MAMQFRKSATVVGIILLSIALAGVGLWRGEAPIAWAGGSYPTVEIQGELYYIVRGGDTLDDLAQAFGVSTEELVEANQLPADGSLRVGQRLLIPDGSDVDLMPADAELIDAEIIDEAEDEPEDETETAADIMSDRESGMAAGAVEDGFYIVERGDTLQRIARVTGVSISDLVRFNNLQVAQAFRVGQRLRLTPDPSPAPQAETQAETMSPAAPQPRQYTIQRGDSLQRIAYLFKVSVSDILRANTSINPARALTPGQVITIPVAGGAVTDAAPADAAPADAKGGGAPDADADDADADEADASMKGDGERDADAAPADAKGGETDGADADDTDADDADASMKGDGERDADAAPADAKGGDADADDADADDTDDEDASMKGDSGTEADRSVADEDTSAATSSAKGGETLYLSSVSSDEQPDGEPGVEAAAGLALWRAGENERIHVFTPAPDFAYHTQLEIIGFSQTTEGNVEIQLIDEDGEILAERYATGGSIDGHDFFRTHLRFHVQEPVSATLMVFERSMKEGDEMLAEVEIPLTLLPGQRFIDIYQPEVGGSLCEFVLIAGYSNTFEANVSLEITDRDGEVLEEAYATGGAYGIYREFFHSFDFSDGEAMPLLITAYELDASDRFDRIDPITVPVSYFPTCE